MPVVHKNVFKAARQGEKRRLRNRSVQSGVKNLIKKLQAAVEANKTEDEPACSAKPLEAWQKPLPKASSTKIPPRAGSRASPRRYESSRRSNTALPPAKIQH